MTFDEITGCLDLLAAQAMAQMTAGDRMRLNGEDTMRKVEMLRHELAAAIAAAEMVARADGVDVPKGQPSLFPLDEGIAALGRAQPRRAPARKELPPATAGRNTDTAGYIARVHEVA